MPNSRLYELLNIHLSAGCTPEQEMELLQLLNDPDQENDAKNILGKLMHSNTTERSRSKTSSEALLQKIFESTANAAPENLAPKTQVHRIHFLPRKWLKYAAAVILVLSAAITAIIVSSDQQSPSSETTSHDLVTDIPPGGEKAILTLADGTKIILDEAANGQLADQGGAQVVKLANGQIAYDVSSSATTPADEVWNTMTTPVGGQYRVTLPDGTKVWLNAASSITYPAAFVSDNRQVKITGEVYFEVSENKTKPFLVDVDGKSLIEVLGTSFNVNSYKDEGSIKATLLEGSIKFSGAATTAGSNRQYQSAAVIKPGQEASIQVDGSGQVNVANNADLEKTLAWKNGLFNFEGLDLEAVMRQLERWYDINVQYRSSKPDLIFHGKMYRNVNISYVLEMFKEMGVKLELKGKNLIVL